MEIWKNWCQSPRIEKYLNTLLFVALVLLVSRLWGNGFTSGDEGFTAFARIRLGGFWRAAFEMASSQGRFYQLYVYTLAQIPYLGESLPFINFCRIVSSGLVFIACYYFVLELWGRDIAVLVSVLTIAFVQTVGGGYNPFHGLPFWFNSGLMFLFLSLAFYIKALRSNSSLFFPSFLGFLALLHYEPFVLFFPAYPLIYIKFRSRAGSNLLQKAQEFIKKSPWTLIFTALYLVLYVSFKAMVSSNYEGTKLSLGSFRSTLYTIWQFSANGVLLEINERNLVNHDWRAFLMTCALTLVLTTKMYQISKSKQGALPQGWGKTALLILPFVFLPNILFGFTERYRNWVLSEPYYIGSFYSGFAFCILMGVLVYWLLSSRVTEKTKRIFFALFSIVFALIVYNHQIHSYIFFDESRREAARWKLADQLGAAIVSENIGTKAICTETFLPYDDPYDYWSYYLSQATSRQISLKYVKGKSELCDSYLEYRRDGRERVFDFKDIAGAPIKVFKASSN